MERAVGLDTHWHNRVTVSIVDNGLIQYYYHTERKKTWDNIYAEDIKNTLKNAKLYTLRGL